jgi:DNA-binding LacI/PurR family transcriptional regulator
MAKERITSVEVALAAGVSQSAVSRTFTPGASVSENTRKKVLKAAKALGYRPNAIARSLITSKSRIIAVVIAYFDNQFYPDLLGELSSRLHAQGYQILLFSGFLDRDSDDLLSQILQYQVDGIILLSSSLSSEISAECASLGVPVVLVNRTTAQDDVSSVTSDNFRGGELVANFLLAGGHKRFAYISGTPNSSTNRDREAGFLRRLRAQGIKDVEKVRGNYSWQGAAEGARQLLSSKKRPDAIFCANDHMALSVMDVARYEFGLQIPRDLSVVGYDDAGAARWSSYNLTTVEQPVKEMAAAAAQIMLSQISQEVTSPVHTIVPSALVIRSSARTPNPSIDWNNHKRGKTSDRKRREVADVQS